MLKRILLAVAPVVMMFGTVSADDDLLKSLAALDTSLVATADVAADTALEDEDDFGQADVDALLGNDDNDEDAVAACFRRVGYGYGYSPSYRRYGYSYGYSSSYYYRPTYSYNCYRPVTYTYYHPVTYHVPVYTSYWACY